MKLMLSLFLIGLHVANAGQQHLCVFGKVDCATDPDYKQGHVVKLWDEDEGPNPDDLMAEDMTRSDGSFHLCGTAGDWGSSIDPIFKIYTHCNNAQEKDMRCFRKLSFPINKQYIGGNYTFPEPIQLANRTTTEQRRCFTGSKWADFMKRYTGETFRGWWTRLTGDNASGILKVLVTAAALLDEPTANATVTDISQ